MEKRSAAPPLRPSEAVWYTVLTDRWAQVPLALFAAATLLYLLPILSHEQRAELTRAWGTFAFLALAVGALASGRGHLASRERRFWDDVTLGFGAWLVGSSLFLFYPRPDKPEPVALALELLYAAYYIALTLAAERQPHRHRRRPARRLDRALTWPAVTLFVLALLGYFVLLPTFRGPGSDDLAGYLLYLTLDVYLVVRFLTLARAAPQLRWRTLYFLLGLCLAAVFVNDLLERLVYAEAPARWGSTFDLVFFIPYLFLILAARGRHFPFPKDRDAKPAGESYEIVSGPHSRTMVYALALPLLHLGCYRAGLLDPALREDRETLVLAGLVVLGAVALVQHRVLARQTRRLWRERARIEESLRHSEQDLRLMVERYHAEKKVRLSEDKFAKAFRLSPDAMALSSIEGGTVLDVNDGFEQVFGYPREEVVGRNAYDLELWADPGMRDQMIRMLEEEGMVRNLEARFQRRSGEIGTALFSAEKVVIDGEGCILSVTHDITERKRMEDRLRSRVAVLESARDAAAGGV